MRLTEKIPESIDPQALYSSNGQEAWRVLGIMSEFTVATEGPTLWIAKALSSAGLVKSTGEGKRLVEQGGVDVDQVRVSDANFQLERGKRYLLRVGSKNRRFAYVVVGP